MQGIAVMAHLPGDADLGVVELEGEGGTLLRGKWGEGGGGGGGGRGGSHVLALLDDES